MNVIDKIRRHGFKGSLRKLLIKINNKSGYTKWRFQKAPVYANPTESELAIIETDLTQLGVKLYDHTPSPEKFKLFQQEGWFSPNYHGGQNSAVWDEKLLEHWLASEMLGLMHYDSQEIYIDIAAAGSPWAKTLRGRKNIFAYAIDLCEIGDDYKDLPYYRIENATATSFTDSSVKGVSLHCAYEMFMGSDDTRLIVELMRILQPGGKAVILPLYMHTHYCAYATAEYFGKGYSDASAKEYVRLDCSGVPSSRKYDAKKLKERVLEPIEAHGMQYRIHVLRNKHDFGQGVYCHFILEIEK